MMMIVMRANNGRMKHYCLQTTISLVLPILVIISSLYSLYRQSPYVRLSVVYVVGPLTTCSVNRTSSVHYSSMNHAASTSLLLRQLSWSNLVYLHMLLPFIIYPLFLYSTFLPSIILYFVFLYFKFTEFDASVTCWCGCLLLWLKTARWLLSGQVNVKKMQFYGYVVLVGEPMVHAHLLRHRWTI